MSFGLNAQICSGNLGASIFTEDFGSGGSLFGPALPPVITGYIYGTTNVSATNVYAITNNSGVINNGWTNDSDHTGNIDGYMMLVNGDSIPSQLYRKTVTGLCPSTTYVFSAYVANVNTQNIVDNVCGSSYVFPELAFQVEFPTSNVLTSITTGTIPVSTSNSLNWIQSGLAFTTGPGQTSAEFVILNNAGGGCGNDFAIDDITLSPCGPAIALNLSATNSLVCEGEQVNLTSSFTLGSYASPEYQWQYSNNNGTTWTDLIGATSANYLITSATTANSGLYQLLVSESGNILNPNCRVIAGPLSFTVNSTPIISTNSSTLCFGETATLNVFGALNYTWMPGSTSGSIIVTSPLSTTNYTVIGSNGCLSIPVTATVMIKPVPIPILTTNNPMCSAQTLNLFASGGTTYQWTGPNAYNSNLQNPSITNVSISNSGSYSLIVTAANSCTAFASASISIFATPNITISSTPTCAGQTLNLFANAAAGSAYSWSGVGGFSSNLQNPAINNANLSQSGPYTVTVTSIQGCTNNAVVNASIVPPPFPVATLSGNGTLCAQALNGSPNTITLSASGANTYTLSTPAYIANNNPLGLGSVTQLFTIPPFQNVTTIATATLMGSNGVCTASIPVTFTIIPNPTVTVSSATPVICAGQSFTYTSNGAASYSWGPGTPSLTTYTSANTIASPTVTSVYSIVGGSLGCNSGTQTSTLTVNPLPVLLPSSGSVCIGSAITLSVGGTATNFTWSPNVGLSSTNGSTVSASPSSYQVYNIIGEANTCTSSAQAWVYVLPLPQPNLTASSRTPCLNETTNLQGFGAGSNGTYEWKFPDGNNYQGQSINLLLYNMAFAGTYTLVVADDKGCKNSTTTNLNIKPLPTGSLLGNTQGCVPLCTKLTFSSNSPSTTATWQYNQTPLNLNSKNCFNTAGAHILSGYLVNAITGCKNIITKNINVYEKPIADFSYNPNSPVEGLDEVVFTNTSKGENLATYIWHFSANIPLYNNTGYQAETKNTNYLFDKAGTYAIAMIVKNTWGCVDTVTKSVRVENDFNLFIPNSFTPNEDDRNEVFQAKGTGVATFKLLIYDRWGEMVFETTDITKGWDGSFKGEPCKSDIYAWKLRATDINGKAKELMGHVTLYR